jgi:hypothetical protein
MLQNNIWYIVEDPRDLPCWKVNPKLWGVFNNLRQQNDLQKLDEHDCFTESYVVQSIDLILLKEQENY